MNGANLVLCREQLAVAQFPHDVDRVSKDTAQVPIWDFLEQFLPTRILGKEWDGVKEERGQVPQQPCNEVGRGELDHKLQVGCGTQELIFLQLVQSLHDSPNTNMNTGRVCPKRYPKDTLESASASRLAP